MVETIAIAIASPGIPLAVVSALFLEESRLFELAAAAESIIRRCLGRMVGVIPG